MINISLMRCCCSWCRSNEILSDNRCLA